MARRPEPLVRKTVTVLFCDVVGSTILGERVDPETNRRVMLRYFDIARVVLEGHGGRVEKFIGDAAMGVFGVPHVHEDDALRAVTAANQLLMRLERLNEELDQRWGVRLAWRIGINTGEVVIGDPASTQTIGSGAVFNVAARLQQAAQPGQILIGKETYRLVRERVSAGPLESFQVKGKREPVKTWRLDEVRAGTDEMFRRLGSPLVGRERERAVLDALYRKALDEQSCRLVTVLGPAGIGKTRLAQELVAQLLGTSVAQGRCLSYGEGITFFPVTEIVRVLAGFAAEDDLEVVRERIANLLPSDAGSALVADRIVGLVHADMNVHADELFWAVRKLFEAVAAARELVLMCEWMPSAETTPLDLPSHLVGWSSGAPMLVLALARSELFELRPSWPGDRVVLEPLASSDVRALLSNLFGDAEVDPLIAQKIEVAAEGNPLFVEELTRMLIDEGTLVREGGRWVSGEVGEFSIPPSISAVLAARIDRLDAEEQVVLQCAAVIGKQFWWSAVTYLAPTGLRERVGAHLHSLVRKRFLAPAESTTFANEDTFRFGHILVRDAAYAALPKTNRAELHERFADWLERRGAFEEFRGHHLERAYHARTELGPLDDETRLLGQRAGSLLASAGRRAFAREDMPAAVELLGRAVTLLPEGDDRREGMHDLSAALWVVGQQQRADEVLENLLEAAAQAADRRMEWYGRMERAGRRNLMGEAPAKELEAAAREAVTMFEELGDDLGLARAWRRIAYVAERRCSYSAAAQASERAFIHAGRVGADQEEARAADRLCMALLYGPTPVAVAVQRCEEILAAARPNLLTEANVLSALAGLEAMIGSFAGARAAYRRAREIYDELGLPLLASGLTVISGPVELAAGNAAAAEAELRFGVEFASEHGYERVLGYRAALLAVTLLAQGKRDEATEFVERSRRTAAAGDVAANVVWRSTQALLTADDALAREAVGLAAATDALNLQGDAHTTLAEVCALLGREAEAEAERDAAITLYTRKGNTAAASLVAPDRNGVPAATTRGGHDAEDR